MRAQITKKETGHPTTVIRILPGYRCSSSSGQNSDCGCRDRRRHTPPIFCIHTGCNHIRICRSNKRGGYTLHGAAPDSLRPCCTPVRPSPPDPSTGRSKGGQAGAALVVALPAVFARRMVRERTRGGMPQHRVCRQKRHSAAVTLRHGTPRTKRPPSRYRRRT